RLSHLVILLGLYEQVVEGLRFRRDDLAHHAELVAARGGEHDPLHLALADVDPPRAPPDQPLDLGLLAAVARAEIEVEAVLDRLRIVAPDQEDRGRGRMAGYGDTGVIAIGDAVAERGAPERGRGLGVVAVKDHLADARGHA